MIDLDISIFVLAFAILSVFISEKTEVTRYLAKYMVLIGAMVATFEFWSIYGSLVLLTLFWFTIVIFVIALVVDTIMLIPMVVDIRRTKRRGK